MNSHFFEKMIDVPQNMVTTTTTMATMATSWHDLPMELRCDIIKRIPADMRLTFWMMHDVTWEGMFNDDVKHDPKYIARVWSFRDPILEHRMMALCERSAMNNAAALRGYGSWLARSWLTVNEYEANDISFWLAIGGHIELLRDYLASGTTRYDINLLHALWTAVALEDNKTVFTKLLEWRITPRTTSYDGLYDEAEVEDLFKILGRHVANKVVRHCVIMDGMDTDIHQLMHNTSWARAVLLGIMEVHRFDADARSLFEFVMNSVYMSTETMFELIEAAITMDSPERLEFVRFWIDDMHYPTVADHTAILTYVAKRAIKRDDFMLLRYIVEGAEWGEWELTEEMLLHACNVGTVSQVTYLLESDVPRSSRAYAYCFTHDKRELLDALIEHGVPLEDMAGNALEYAVENVFIDMSTIERLIEIGCSVTLKVVANAATAEMFNKLLTYVPNERHAEYKHYVLYNALACDNTERVLQLFDDFNLQVPRSFYYHCCMLNAGRTFVTAWQQRRFLETGIDDIEHGIALNTYVIYTVWSNPHFKISWHYVLQIAEEQRNYVSIAMLKYLMKAN